jgi:segregation and condensation protein B
MGWQRVLSVEKLVIFLKKQTETGRLLKSVSARYRMPRMLGTSLRRIARESRFHPYGGNGAAYAGGRQPGGVREEALAQLEAVLFLSPQPLGSRKLAQLAGLADGTKARTLVRTLNRRYDAGGSAFRVEEAGGGFQLYTRPKFAPWLRRLQATTEEVRLSGPALETLAVIAYRQPVLRAEIEAIRGVQSGEVLRQLIERDMVRVVGRSGELGRPFLYGTTRRFLQIFGLRYLDDLPPIEERRTSEPSRGGPPPGAGSIAEESHSPQPFPEAVEEKDVKTSTTNPIRPALLTGESSTALMDAAPEELLPRMQSPEPDADKEDADADDDDFEDEDFDDLEEDEEFEDEEEDDEELEDEWEEVEEDDEEEEDAEGEEEDEDWEDEDWDDDEDWDEDEDEEEEEWEEEEEK